VHDYETLQTTAALLICLLDNPTSSWDKEGLDDLRLEVGCGEYEDSFTNLIALGLQSKEGFDAAQLEKLNTLIRLMNLECSD
jgi:hypothetical protein